MVISVVTAVATTLISVTAAQSRPAASTINIGWDGDQSGPTVAAQAPVMHAIEAYFKMVNDRGGVNGHKLNLIEKDDGYSPAMELSVVKSLINDDHVPVIMGLGNSSGFGSVLPVLTASHTVGILTQATLKDASWPFQPWIYETACTYADQVDVGLAYEMRHLRLKSLKGVKVGVAAIQVASGTEWTQNVEARVRKLGGSIVNETLPAAIVNADVQVQDLIANNVKFVMIHHALTGGVAFLKSAAKYGLNVPMTGSYGVTQEEVWRATPYTSNQYFTGVNCVSPPYLAKTSAGKLAQQMGKKYGYPDNELRASNWSLGWIAAQFLVEGLKNAKGDYSGDGIRKGLDKVRGLATGLSVNLSAGPSCHLVNRGARPYGYNYKTDRLVPIGSFEQWQRYITNAYAAPGTCGVKRGK